MNVLMLLALAAFTSAELEADVKAQLERALPEKMRVVEVELPAHFYGASGEISAVSAFFRAAPKVGRSMIALNVEKTDGSRTKSWASVKVETLVSIAIATRELAAGHVVTSADIEVVERLGGLQEELPLGKELARPVKAGATIAQHDVVLAPPLTRGTKLSIIARSGAIEITVEGTLERPARPGETAVARSSDSNRLIRGRLIDQRTLLAERSAR